MGLCVSKAKYDRQTRTLNQVTSDYNKLMLSNLTMIKSYIDLNNRIKKVEDNLK